MKTFIIAIVSFAVAQCGTKLADQVKSAATKASTSISLPSATSGLTSILNSDFLTGFESGIFLRE
jgi:hypothetical protein